jgi:hypothetical protein
MGKYCFIQVSDRLLNPDVEDNPADNYYKELWPNMAKHGYFKPHHYWEIPTWIAQMSYALGNGPENEQELYHVTAGPTILPEADVYFMSVLDCNKDILARIVRMNPDKQFVLGGYIEYSEIEWLFGPGSIHCQWYESIEDYIHIEFGMNVIYRYGTCYDLFRGMMCIPRLALSEGCHHSCKFCSIDNTVVQYSGIEILQQAESFRDLHFELVYINDKTFGQASNCKDLKYLYNTIKAYNPDFRGFIVQTSCAQVWKWMMNDIVLDDLHIVNVEIGVESYNDCILRKYNKPQSTVMIDKVVDWVLREGMNVIPNIIIGLPGENMPTYTETLMWLHERKDDFRMLNITNFVPYAGSEMEPLRNPLNPGDENQTVTERTWHSSEDAAAVKTFTKFIFRTGMEIIQREVKV